MKRIFMLAALLSFSACNHSDTDAPCNSCCTQDNHCGCPQDCKCRQPGGLPEHCTYH